MENKINYQKELEKETKKWSELGVCPTILLHCCCAPCASYCMEYLSQFAWLTAFYYNPNITDENEYRHRVSELKRLIDEMMREKTGADTKMDGIGGNETGLSAGMLPGNRIDFMEGEYVPERFYEIAKGLENEPECGRRCILCYELRLRKTAEEAAKGGYDYFTTTLTISPLKDAQVLNHLGQKLAAEYGVKYLPSDFKKNGGYQRSIELSKKYNLYRQNFCGCEFSRR